MKLVRDNIPQLAPHRKFRKATHMELPQLVADKVMEEAQEVKEAAQDWLYSREGKQHLTEELADLHEVMLKLAEISGIHWDDVEVARQEKKRTKGGFDGNWVLVEDDS